MGDSGHSNIKIGSDRGFGVVFAVVFAIVGLWPLLDGAAVRPWALLIGGGFLAVALIYPRALHPLNVLWFRFGLLLGRVVTPIVMAIVFFVTVVPTGLIMRLLGKRPLRLEIDRHAPTYWQNRDDETHRVGSMKNQF